MRISTWSRWIVLPWRPAGAAAALLGSFAVPALMVSSATMFEESASDAIVARLVAEETPRSLGATVTMSGRFGSDAVTELGALIDPRLATVGDPIRTLVTDRLDIDVVGTPSAEPVPGGRRGGRLFARPGAIEGLDVVAGAADVGDAWVSQRQAERYGLRPGDVVRVGGPVDLVIAGIYADLWDEPSPYWDDVPPELVPRFVPAFNAPNFELVIVSDETMLEVAPSGEARWESPLRTPPQTDAELRALVASYGSIERAFTQDAALVDALDRFAGPGRPSPVLESRAGIVADRAAGVGERLGPPISVTRLGGVAIGLAVTGAGAVFAVRRRAGEFRLLAADGDAAWRFVARGATQYTAPATVGAGLGVALGWTIVRLAGPSGSARLAAVDWWAVTVVTSLGLAVAAAICGFMSRRVVSASTSTFGQFRASWLWLVIGLAVAGWVQVGSAGRAGDFDIMVVAFPIVGLCAGVGVTLAALRWVLRRSRHSGGSLPTPLFLAWRRLTAAEAGSLLLAGSIGVAFGLTVFSAVFVDTLRAAADAKVVTVVGATSRIDVLGPFPAEALPDESTLIRTQSTRATPGRNVEVVAVDPDTFAEVVDWPDVFGGSADGLVERLGRPVDGAVPAVVVGDRTIASSGGIGRSTVIPYRIVGSVVSVPLASAVHPTIVIRADVADRLARERFDVEGGGDRPFVSPLDNFGRTIVSRLDATALHQATTEALMRTRDPLSRSEAMGTVENEAIGWAFQYLRLLGVVAAIAALGALAAYLVERRASRAVATVMTEQMGMPASATRWAAVFELLGLVVVALAASCITAVVIASRLFPRFEPDPRLPPAVGLRVDLVLVATIVVVSLIAVILLAVAVHRPIRSTSKAMVLRGGT